MKLIVKFKRLLLIPLVSLGMGVPLALAQRPVHPPGSIQQHAMHHHHRQMHRGGMMHEMQVNNEFEYLTQMIPHHQEAIDTARQVLARSDRPEMKRFAQEIIRVQSAEIEQMRRWLNEWYRGRNFRVTYTPMMRDLNSLRGNALDQAFLEDMIMHHMGAVMMSQMLLNRNLVQHPPVRPFAQQIASSQRQEMVQMRSWLRNWFGANGGMPGMMRRPDRVPGR